LESANFEFRGFLDGETIRTSVSGYATRLAVEGFEPVAAIACAAGSQGDVVLWTNHTRLSHNSVIVTFTISNGGVSDALVGVATEVQAFFDDQHSPPVMSLDDNRGFVVYSSRLAMSVLCRGFSLVDNVTTCWFGPFKDLPNNSWAQVQDDCYHAGHSAFVWSWQDITIPPDGLVRRSVILMLGLPDANKLFLTVSMDSGHVVVGHPFGLEVSVSTRNGTAVISIILIVDSDPSSLLRVAENIAHDLCAFAFDLALTPGGHNFTFYAVDEVGTVSNEQPFSVFVGTPSPHPTESAAPPTVVPSAPRVPIEWQCAIAANFDVTGRYDGETVRTTTAGFATCIRTAVDTVGVFGCGPEANGQFNLSTHITTIALNTVLVSFRISNAADEPGSVDVSFSSDIYFDGHDDAAITATEHGVIVFSERLALTIMGVIHDPSTVWFGSY
jgi:hypothetical protein